MRRVEQRAFGLVRLTAPEGRLARLAFWLLVVRLVFWALSVLPGEAGGMFRALGLLDSTALVLVATLLLFRWMRRRLLWSLRNKLVLTYLLIGLAPMVLFVTLAGISAYVLAGQFAIYIASSRIRAEAEHLAASNQSYAMHAARLVSLRNHASIQGTPDPALPFRPGVQSQGGHGTAFVPRDAIVLPELSREEETQNMQQRETAAFLDGKKLPLLERNGEIVSTLQLPEWAKDGFKGLVLDNNKLYLRVVTKEVQDGKTLDFISSLPIDQGLLDRIAQGVGRIAVLPVAKIATDLKKLDAQTKTGQDSAESLVYVEPEDKQLIQELRLSAMFGGTVPTPVNLYDRRVRLASSLPAMDWMTGKQELVGIDVNSLPSLLYTRLFDASLDMAQTIRTVFIIIAVLFGLLELFALYMATRLSRTITQSVAALYDATQRIDKGELSHRIAVTRSDQLAQLSKSFNRMTWSLERLLEEQKEKERLQNELSIAQEVQANLFPRGAVGLKDLELHGVCKPARAVSGDYYDFLLFNRDGRETGLGIAIGDISGKGISAALLMATLHSAVRAYRFAGEELVYAGSAVEGLMAHRGVAADRGAALDPSSGAEIFESPGRILSLLNRHLYRSTQPEKYATLFLAHYSADTARLTYSNAGQLPPLVLAADGSVRRLDQGGTVVGLMDGMHYDEGTVQLNPGDIVIGYSDGVTEPENDFGEFGEHRLIEIVGQHRHKPLQAISDQVMQALHAWIGAQEQPDDITLVLARQL